MYCKISLRRSITDTWFHDLCYLCNNCTAFYLLLLLQWGPSTTTEDASQTTSGYGHMGSHHTSIEWCWDGEENTRSNYNVIYVLGAAGEFCMHDGWIIIITKL